MIHVIATINVKPGKRDAFLAEFHRIVPLVHAEAGCIELWADGRRGERHHRCREGRCAENVAVIIEKWESLDAAPRHFHTQAPHMADYRVRVKDLRGKRAAADPDARLTCRLRHRNAQLATPIRNLWSNPIVFVDDGRQR